MKRFCLLAVLMLSAPLAHAGEGLSFSIGGHRIHIDSTRCRAQSCVSVSDRSRRDEGAGRALKPEPAPVPTATIPAVASASKVPAPALAVAATPSPVIVDKPAPAPPPPAVAPPPSAAPSPPRVMTVEPPPVVAPRPPATPPVTRVSRETGDEPDDGPVGDWQTDADNLVRVRRCGDALCGYALDKTTRDLGEAVLINMKPKNDARWNGSVYDPGRGSIQYGTIELKAADKMRVEACVFGRFYCTGADWVRVSHPRHRVVTQGALRPAPRS